MKLRHTWLVVLFSATLLVACAGGGGGGSANNGYPVGYSAAPSGSDFAKIQLDASEYDVRKILGEPDRANAYMTGKAWIPFYFGTDVARTDWFYSGQGRVVFSRNRYTGALKVIRVLYSAAEP